MMRLSQCYNFHDFRRLARRRLPAPIFDYIDGAADDEAKQREHAEAGGCAETCTLLPTRRLATRC